MVALPPCAEAQFGGFDFNNPTRERGIADGPSLTRRVVKLPPTSGPAKKSQPLGVPCYTHQSPKLFAATTYIT